MQELLKAVKKIKDILRKCEEENDDFGEVLNKLGHVKVYGVQFPTMMLMEITDDFAKGYNERRKASVMKDFDEKELQDKYSVGFRKTVENFKAGKATTERGGEARFWVVVFQDYEVRLQTKPQIMDVVTEGHKNREDDDNAKFERSGSGTKEEHFTLD